jgi:hypothetical protein
VIRPLALYEAPWTTSRRELCGSSRVLATASLNVTGPIFIHRCRRAICCARQARRPTLMTALPTCALARTTIPTLDGLNPANY